MKNKKIVWLFQMIAAVILFSVGVLKFINNPTDIYIFTELGMEPGGRYLIGFLEVVSGLLLITDGLSATGAFLGIGVMCGAILAHGTVLGVSVRGDNGKHIILLSIVFASCLIVALMRRKEIPIIGSNL